MADLTLRDLIDPETIEEKVRELVNEVLSVRIRVSFDNDSLSARLAPDTDYICPECSEVFTTNSALGSHRRYKHDVKATSATTSKKASSSS